MARTTPINTNAIVGWVNISPRGLGVIVLVTIVQYEVRVDTVIVEGMTVGKIVQIVVLAVKVVQVAQLVV